MKVRVLLFASLREAVGQAQVEVDLPEGSTAEDLWRRLVQDHAALAARRASLAAAVNRRYAPFDTTLGPGDEVVFVPPVSGG